ncbi:hypothetical protein D3C81_1452620 [compost metagenome]
MPAQQVLKQGNHAFGRHQAMLLLAQRLRQGRRFRLQGQQARTCFLVGIGGMGKHGQLDFLVRRGQQALLLRNARFQRCVLRQQGIEAHEIKYEQNGGRTGAKHHQPLAQAEGIEGGGPFLQQGQHQRVPPATGLGGVTARSADCRLNAT